MHSLAEPGIAPRNVLDTGTPRSQASRRPAVHPKDLLLYVFHAWCGRWPQHCGAARRSRLLHRPLDACPGATRSWQRRGASTWMASSVSIRRLCPSSACMMPSCWRRYTPAARPIRPIHTSTAWIIWNVACPATSGPATGWLGRHLQLTAGSNDSPLRAVGMGGLLQMSLRGTKQRRRHEFDCLLPPWQRQ